MKKIIQSIVLATALTTALTGCAPRLSGNDYSLKGTGEISHNYTGVITSARPINLTGQNGEDGKIGPGALVGGAAGAVGGSLLGRGRGALLGGALGALVGGVGGHLAERKLTEQQGMEYTIQMDSGQTITVTQGIEPALAVGQRVRVIESAKDRSRVIPA